AAPRQEERGEVSEQQEEACAYQALLEALVLDRHRCLQHDEEHRGDHESPGEPAGQALALLRREGPGRIALRALAAVLGVGLRGACCLALDLFAPPLTLLAQRLYAVSS